MISAAADYQYQYPLNATAHLQRPRRPLQCGHPQHGPELYWMVSHVQVEAQSELACKSCHEVSQEVIAPLRQICTKNHVLPMFIKPHLWAFRGRWHALTWC